jgi:hypothetical protein
MTSRTQGTLSAVEAGSIQLASTLNMERGAAVAERGGGGSHFAHRTAQHRHVDKRAR